MSRRSKRAEKREGESFFRLNRGGIFLLHRWLALTEEKEEGFGLKRKPTTKETSPKAEGVSPKDRGRGDKGRKESGFVCSSPPRL